MLAIVNISRLLFAASESRVICSTSNKLDGGYNVNDIAGCVGSLAAWSASRVAVQQGLGLLSERWFGVGGRGFACAAARWKIVILTIAAVAASGLE